MATPAAPCQPTHLQQTLPPASLGKRVHFGTPESQSQDQSGVSEASPTGLTLKTAVAASHPLSSSAYNELFSPGSEDSWTIEAQRSTGGKMETSPLSCTPASASFLESARKADDLRGRLESLEAALKEMESKAVAHLDRSLQEKVLATAAKIVQKRFLADKQLDKKLEQTILQTALKVVQRQTAAAAATAAAQTDREAGNPTRKLEFVEQGGNAGSSSDSDTGVPQYVAQIEQGLGEVLRRLEKKVESVASMLDQNVLELVEARLAGGLVQVQARLGALEEAQQQPAAASAAPGGTSLQLLERVAAVEAAMAEQSRAVTDLLAALGTQGAAGLQQAAAAAAEAAAAAKAPDAQQAAAAAEPAAPAVEEQQEAAPPAQQPYQRKSAAAKRSALGDPDRSARAAAVAAALATRSAALPRLQPAHSAGTAQQIAMHTAREQLARQAQRARQEAEGEAPVWVTMFYVFGWGALALLGLAACLVGTVAVLLRSGRISEGDLAFLWEQAPR